MFKPTFKIKAVFGRIVEDFPLLPYFALKAKLTAISLAPEKTGYLKSTIYSRYGKTFFEVGATAPYAPYQESGVNPYILRLKYSPKKSVTVPIMTPKGLIFRTLTHQSNWFHPGIKPKHFIRRGIESVYDDVIKYAVEETINQYIRSVRSGRVIEYESEVK